MCKIDSAVPASTSEETDAVDPEEATSRPSGERPRSRPSGAAPRQVEAFDDVTPARSIVSVGLADMDEDVPTRMQTLDELARFRSAAADEAEPVPEPRRDAFRPPPAPAPAEPVVFRSFPAPPGRDSVPSVPPAPAMPREASTLRDPEAELEESFAPPSVSPPAEPDGRGTRILLAISFAMIVLAAVALAIERFAP